MAKVATNGETVLEVGDEVEVDRSSSVRSYGRNVWINRGDRGVVEAVWNTSTVEVRFPGAETTLVVSTRDLVLL